MADKINQPFDFLEHTQFLTTILHENFALLHNDYRPLQEFDQIMRQFARDFLRNFLFRKYYVQMTGEKPDIEEIIKQFEQEVYGTENNEQKIV